MKFPRWGEFNIRQGIKFRGLSREEILVWGTVTILFFLVAIILWDGYLFYHTTIRKRVPGALVKKAVTLSPEEIEEVVNLLDERKQKFDELLAKPPK